MVIIIRVTQGKKKTLYVCINHFIKVVVVIGSYEILKCWIFEKSLGLDYSFKEKSVWKEVCNLNDLLCMVHTYINYEEKLLADEGN